MNLTKQIFLFGFVFFILNLTTIAIPSAHAENHDKSTGNVSGTVSQQIGIKSPGIDLWNAVRQRNPDGSENLTANNPGLNKGNITGISQVKGPNASTLINIGGEEYRTWRVSTLIPYSMFGIGGALLVIGLFRLIRGKIKIKAGRSGKKIKRFTDFQRFVHWSVAILFVILGITGVILTLGRYGLLPLVGKEAFGVIAYYGKLLHNYLGPVFSVMMVVMLFTFIKGNFFNWTDFKWFAKGGGLFGKHASAGRYNGGEKAWYWIAALAGSVVIVSGLLLNFPWLIAMINLSNENYELAQLLHAVGSIGLFVVSFGHIYMGTIAMEGAFEVMKTGECDSNWAKEHHDLWYEELQKEGLLTMQDESSNNAPSNENPQTA